MTPGAGTPPGTDTPQTRHTTPPPRPGTPPPPRDQAPPGAEHAGRYGHARAVRILLECNLVYSVMFRSYRKSCLSSSRTMRGPVFGSNEDFGSSPTKQTGTRDLCNAKSPSGLTFQLSISFQ